MTTLPLELSGVIRDDATQGTPAHDDPGMGRPWTEDDMLRVLWRHFTTGGWAPVPQVTVANRDLDGRADLSGWERHRRLDDRADWTDRRIDMLLMRPARKPGIGPIETLAIEAKVTRADYANDLRHPEKQAPWRRAAHRHAYAVPAGLIRRDEIPDGSGLIVVKHSLSGHGAAEWALRAPYRPNHAPTLPPRVHVALAHRLAALESRTRGWVGSADDDDAQALRAALVAAQKAADRAERAAERESAKADAWRTAHALAVGTGHPCRWCGEPLKPLNPDKGWFKRWRHVNGAHDDPCQEAERQERENAAVDEWEAATEVERRAKVREAHRWGFSERVEAEPWRAFIPDRIGRPGEPFLTGPEPADIMPDDCPPAVPVS